MSESTKQQRSRMMAAVKCKDTSPELHIRKALFSKGLRYRLHGKDLPGKPDLVFPKYKAVIFINGCFWHNHDCALGKMPVTNQSFWQNKLVANRLRDEENIPKIQKLGWKVKVIWLCELKNKKTLASEDDLNSLIGWIQESV